MNLNAPDNLKGAAPERRAFKSLLKIRRSPEISGEKRRPGKSAGPHFVVCPPSFFRFLFGGGGREEKYISGKKSGVQKDKSGK